MKHIVIFGPTAIGKTSLSIKLAKKYNSEIISADSAQIYRGVNIGTAKIAKEEMQGIKHHMIDIVNIREHFNLVDFVNKSTDILNRLESEGKRAIIVGGTGLYLEALTEGITLIPKANDEVREKLSKEDNTVLYQRLKEVDMEYSNKISINDKERIIKALEVYETTGKIYSSFKDKTAPKHKFKKYALTCDREKLYERINNRVDVMIENGLIDEAKYIFDINKDILDRINIIGYKELFQYFNSEIGLKDAIDKIKQNSRRYAKRQVTWLNNHNYTILNVDEIDVYKLLTK